MIRFCESALLGRFESSGIKRDSTFCKSKTKQKLFCINLRARFCESQNQKIDCHANPADLLAMTKKRFFASLRMTN